MSNDALLYPVSAKRQFLGFSKHTLVNARDDLPLKFDDVAAASRRLCGVAVRTPVLCVERLNQRAGNTLYLKCENLQRMGSFKFRGAYNRLCQLPADQRRNGVVAYSSGNHAQGVALAAKLLGLEATIVMPANAPLTKLEATRSLGAHVVVYDPQRESREEIAARINAERGAVLVPPFDDHQVMAGQGTVALELCEQAGELDCVVVPLGGGGLLSGCTVAVKTLQPHAVVFGVEPQAGDDWQQSWQRGERVSIPPPATIADGLRATTPGQLTWRIVRALADGVLTVSDEELTRAMRLSFDFGRLIVEPSGAAALAAALFGKLPLQHARVGLILSGGNVDLPDFCRFVHE